MAYATRQLTHEISAVIDLKRMIAETCQEEDAELVRDMIEGSTNFLEVMEALYATLAEAETMVTAQKARESELRDRRLRHEEKVATIRALLGQAMQMTGERKVVLTEATLSLSPSRPSVVVTDIDSLPEAFTRIKREADKTAIKAALDGGESVPGAMLSNGGETLTVRKS